MRVPVPGTTQCVVVLLSVLVLCVLCVLLTWLGSGLLTTVALDPFVFGCCGVGLVLAGLFASAVSHGPTLLPWSYYLAARGLAVTDAVHVRPAPYACCVVVPDGCDAVCHGWVHELDEVGSEFPPSVPLGSAFAFGPVNTI
jgi:hypothetical protein